LVTAAPLLRGAGSYREDRADAQDNGLKARVPWNLLMAASTVMVIPMILMFLLGQRYFIKGTSLSGFGGW